MQTATSTVPQPDSHFVIYGPAQPVDKLLEFVDQYDDSSVGEHLDFVHDPYMRKYARPDGPKLTVSDRREDVMLEPFDSRQRQDVEETKAVEDLRVAVLTKLKRPAQIDSERVYALYQEIPEPRISHLPARLRHQLLAALGTIERKDSKSMLRYFAVVADVKNSGFSLTSYEWNTAMSFATRYVGTSTEVETEAALHIWREMEHDAGVKANEVTFNILFDVASKAGNFTLAEMVYREMINRGYTFNRYHHVSLIHFFGLKQNGSGVRAAYRHMVEAGEIIDTITLNCVLSSLLRCGEEESAERLYEKMKNSTEAGRNIPDRNYTIQKSITKVLMMFARLAKAHPDMRPSFQHAALLAPDLQTYRILVNWYGIRLGNLPKVAQFLDEMKFFRVPLHGAIFLALFKSFHIHGGPGSDWSAQRLESVWNAFLNALDTKTEGLHISTWMAMAILRAFSRYSDREQMLDIYEALRSRWNLDLVNSQFMLDFLNKLLPKKRQ
ncbi:hypothetical protein DL764_008736 [Monosporascus ibericus]|uniref:Pentacotripeptide-repeat region of PRORP domain-containing protein n=1 Tax=Monosporascus ibericus TaxID=155417 RepID=A0A4Q4SZR8_9PEZI|nr:hypothetical protein DL764_008736 [Monosporascus ibericus]